MDGKDCFHFLLPFFPVSQFHFFSVLATLSRLIVRIEIEPPFHSLSDKGFWIGAMERQDQQIVCSQY